MLLLRAFASLLDKYISIELLEKEEVEIEDATKKNQQQQQQQKQAKTKSGKHDMSE